MDLRWRANASKGNAFVKISALFSAEAIGNTTIVVGDKRERNQWYFTARDFERGVIRGGSVVASAMAGWLSWISEREWKIPNRRVWNQSKRALKRQLALLILKREAIERVELMLLREQREIARFTVANDWSDRLWTLRKLQNLTKSDFRNRVGLCEEVD